MVDRTTLWKLSLCSAVLCLGLFGCDDGTTVLPVPPGAGTGAGTGAGGASGTSGSPSSGAGGRSGASGTGGMQLGMCTETAPTTPVVCGGQTCPTPSFGMNMCIVPCCATVGGAQVCGAKSTNSMLSTACEPPAKPDPSCPPVDAMGMPLQGCCNAMNQCGIISTFRPGCITQSTLIQLPNPPLACGGDSDGGVDDDAGL